MPGITIAQVLAFTPISMLVLLGVLQGVAPSLEEASQTLAGQSVVHVPHRHLAADPPRPRQRLPDRLHREHGRLRQPAGDRRQLHRAVHRHLLRRGRRIARPGPRRGARHRAAGIHAHRIPGAALLARPAQLRDRRRQGPHRHPRFAAGRRARFLLRGDRAVAAADDRGLRHDPDRRLRRLGRSRQHADAGILLDGVLDREGRRRLVPLRLRLELVHRHHRGRADRHAVHRGTRHPHRVAAGSPAVSRPPQLRIPGDDELRDPRHGDRRVLHPGVQRAAGVAHRHRNDHRDRLRVPQHAGGHPRRPRQSQPDRPQPG